MDSGADACSDNSPYTGDGHQPTSRLIGFTAATRGVERLNPGRQLSIFWPSSRGAALAEFGRRRSRSSRKNGNEFGNARHSGGSDNPEVSHMGTAVAIWFR
jgi:hypothetical protein